MTAPVDTELDIDFVPATRENLYFRGCLHGPGGSGKTYTALTILDTLCEKYAVIDTEHGRSKKYVGLNGWQFGIWTPHQFSPESLVQAIAVVQARGFDGLLIDTGSPYWAGTGGMLERVDQATRRQNRSDSFGSGWKEMSPIERRMWDAILAFEGHLIMNLRVRSQYVIEEKERGGRTTQSPKKVGLAPVQREGFDYEFDLVGALDEFHTMTVMKSDVHTIPSGSDVLEPGVQLANTIAEFCSEGGARAAGPLTYRTRALDSSVTFDELKAIRDEVFGAGFANAAITDGNGRPTTLDALLTERARDLNKQREQAPAAAPPQQAPAPAVESIPAEQPTPSTEPEPSVNGTAVKREPAANGSGMKVAKDTAAMRKVVDGVLASLDGTAAVRKLEWAHDDRDADTIIGHLVPEVDAEALDLRDGQHESRPVSLAGLAGLLVDYTERHKDADGNGRGPRHPDLTGPS